MRRRLTLALTVALIGCCELAMPTFAKKDKLNISVLIEDEGLEGKPELVKAAWLGYAMARANWISEHIKVKSPEAKSYTRSFEEELAGRDSLATIWGELKAQEEGLTDGYLDQLQKVTEAGWLREYVWVNLRAPGWTVEPTGLRLDRYTDWARVNLAGHTLETHGDTRIEVAGGK